MDPSTPIQPPGQADLQAVVHELKAQMGACLDALVAEDLETAASGYGNIYERTRQLVHRKLEVKGTKSETRDLLCELLFSRMRRSMREFLRTPDEPDPEASAKWVMASMFSTATLTEFASAFDRAILEMSAPREYSFAGMADFIAIEEVLQLLGSGKHRGCLTFEKPDNRIDLYLNHGRIAYLDVHRMVRKVLPGSGPMSYREIDESSLREAERVRAEEHIPLLLALHRADVFGDMSQRRVMDDFAVEAFYEFLMEPDGVFFSYRRLPELPDFAKDNDINFGVTPILLEGSKRLDEWRSMLRVFPDRFAPIEPYGDMYARMEGLDLSVVDIKLLAMIDGEHSPKLIAESMGLPIFECYQYLVRLAKDGVVPPPGGLGSLENVTMSVEDTMREAFEALDANDDSLQAESALDRVLDETPAPPAPPAGMRVARRKPKARTESPPAVAASLDEDAPEVDDGIGAVLGAVFGESDDPPTPPAAPPERKVPEDDTCGLFDGDLGGESLSLGEFFPGSSAKDE